SIMAALRETACYELHGSVISARRVRRSVCRETQANGCHIALSLILRWCVLNKRASEGMSMLWKSAWLLTLAGLLLAPAGDSISAEPAKALRDLWSRENDRFVREWLFLGPIPAASAQLDGNVAPTPGAAQPLVGGLTSNWRPNSAYHDIV